jgi:hypothetical protein
MPSIGVRIMGGAGEDESIAGFQFVYGSPLTSGLNLIRGLNQSSSSVTYQVG